MNSRQCWRTPKKIFDQLNKVFKFTVDACADKHNHLLPKYWTEQENCIDQDWTRHKVFCNPPFNDAKRIIHKAREAQDAVFLLPASCLTAKYFAQHPPDYIGVPDFRICFDPPDDTVQVSSPSVGTVALLYNHNAKQIEEFQKETGWQVFKCIMTDD